MGDACDSVTAAAISASVPGTVTPDDTYAPVDKHACNTCALENQDFCT